MRGYLAAVLTLLCLLFFMPGLSEAALSGSGAFVLIQKVAPGTELADASTFLGTYASEEAAEGAGMKIRRWGDEDDDWMLDVLHDGSVVRATRIIWNTDTKREQQTIFSQLTTAGKKYFSRTAKFQGLDQAEWVEMDGKLLVRARIEPELSDGVTLLTGIRNDAMESGKYGF